MKVRALTRVGRYGLFAALAVSLWGARCNPGAVCGNGIVEVGEDCDGTTSFGTVCPATCADGVDNDVNGQADCDDSACANTLACGGGAAENTDALCNDCVDNDGDGAFDCSDIDCRNLPVCQNITVENTCAACTDGISND